MKRIIIADDSATARMFMKKCLEIVGHHDAEFLEAPNGAEALSLLKDNRPDLLISDLTMPVMDGTELLRHISASPKLFGLPILIITSAGNPAKEKELKKLGAKAVLAKPISPMIIARALEDIFPANGEQS